MAELNPVILPVSAIIPTRDRWPVLERTLRSLLSQNALPYEIIIVDASGENQSLSFNTALAGTGVHGQYLKAAQAGATHQRIQGISLASQPYLWFVDDDIIMDPNCTSRLFNGFQISDRVGAVNAMIINQQYGHPGVFSRMMFRCMHGLPLPSYAGKVIGPAWNLLPADSPELPEYVPCEWLNTTCTMYRRDVLPTPVFADFFTGYSMFEDLALSFEIGRSHQLLNARTARIFHDSQPGVHKRSTVQLSRMALVNRYWVMTRVLHRTGIWYITKLWMLEMVGILSTLRNVESWKRLPGVLWGKWLGLITIVARGKSL